MAIAIGIVLVVAFVALPLALFLSAGRKYDAIFADAHFLELARAFPALRAAALARYADDEPPTPPDDPRVLLTSAELIVVYTVSLDDEQFVHHWSVGLRGKPTAGAVGERFALYFAQLLGVALDDVVVQRQPSSVHHVTLVAAKEAHEAIASRPLREPTPRELAQWRVEREARLATMRAAT